MSSERNWTLRIEHLLDAIAKIEQYTENMSETTFANNSLVVDAVIRNFLVIGEAVRHIPNEVQGAHPEIPWTLMRGMRNVLVHNYDHLRSDIVWRTIQNDLPPLVEPLRRLLQHASRDDS